MRLRTKKRLRRHRQDLVGLGLGLEETGKKQHPSLLHDSAVSFHFSVDSDETSSPSDSESEYAPPDGPPTSSPSSLSSVSILSEISEKPSVANKKSQEIIGEHAFIVSDNDEDFDQEQVTFYRPPKRKKRLELVEERLKQCNTTIEAVGEKVAPEAEDPNCRENLDDDARLLAHSDVVLVREVKKTYVVENPEYKSTSSDTKTARKIVKPHRRFGEDRPKNQFEAFLASKQFEQ